MRKDEFKALIEKQKDCLHDFHDVSDGNDGVRTIECFKCGKRSSIFVRPRRVRVR